MYIDSFTDKELYIEEILRRHLPVDVNMNISVPSVFTEYGNNIYHAPPIFSDITN